MHSRIRLAQCNHPILAVFHHAFSEDSHDRAQCRLLSDDVLTSCLPVNGGSFFVTRQSGDRLYNPNDQRFAPQQTLSVICAVNSG